MTPDQYAGPTCRGCGRSVHSFTLACRIVAALLNGGFAALTAILRVPAGELPEF